MKIINASEAHALAEGVRAARKVDYQSITTGDQLRALVAQKDPNALGIAMELEQGTAEFMQHVDDTIRSAVRDGDEKLSIDQSKDNPSCSFTLGYPSGYAHGDRPGQIRCAAIREYASSAMVDALKANGFQASAKTSEELDRNYGKFGVQCMRINLDVSWE